MSNTPGAATTSTAATGTSTASISTALTLPARVRRHQEARAATTAIRKFAARVRASWTADQRPAPSNRWVGPASRDYELGPASHVRMVR